MMQKVDDIEKFVIMRADSSSSAELFSALEELEKQSFSDGWSAESFRSETVKENGCVLYICNGAEVAGLLTGYFCVGEGDITNVAVAEKYRRKGLAKRLISEFIRLLPNDTENVFLEVREYNTSAILLYKSCGFEKISVRKNFYSNPRENAIVMSRKVEVNI